MASEETYVSMIRNAKEMLRDAEVEVARKRVWLQGLEDEFTQFKKTNVKVQEATGDTRTLLNG
jgi:hypothetical protein